MAAHNALKSMPIFRGIRAVLVESDEKWGSDAKACIKWECLDA